MLKAGRNSLVILYEIPAELHTSTSGIHTGINVLNQQIGEVRNTTTDVLGATMTHVDRLNGVKTIHITPTNVNITRNVNIEHAYGMLNIVDGRVIFPNCNFDDPILRYNGDLRFNYSYYKSINGVLEPLRIANMIPPINIADLTLMYDSSKKLLNVDNIKDLVATTIKMPSILASVYMLSKAGYIDHSYSQCIINYLKVMEICNEIGCSYEIPLETSMAIIDTERKLFYSIDATKWEATSVNALVIPWISREFYIISRGAGVQRATPVDKNGVKWCVVETSVGERQEILWQALIIYIQELYTKL